MALRAKITFAREIPTNVHHDYPQAAMATTFGANKKFANNVQIQIQIGSNSLPTLSVNKFPHSKYQPSALCREPFPDRKIVNKFCAPADHADLTIQFGWSWEIILLITLAKFNLWIHSW